MKARDALGVRSFLMLLVLTLMGFSLALFIQNIYALVVLQLFNAALIWAWFSVMHSCAHEAYFRNPHFNAFAGHVASFMTGVPFYCWKYHHLDHHFWAGVRERDPSTRNLVDRKLSARERKYWGLAWRLGLPVFSFFQTENGLWSPTQAVSGIEDEKLRVRRLWQCRISVSAILAGYAVFLSLFGVMGLLRIFGSILIYLFTSDLVLLSQHLDVGSESHQRPLKTKQQEPLARTLRVHPWLDRWVLLNFNLHSAHHLHPNLPHYFLHQIEHKPTLEVSARAWWRRLRAMEFEEVLKKI